MRFLLTFSAEHAVLGFQQVFLRVFVASTTMGCPVISVATLRHHVRDIVRIRALEEM
ncbi:hypothetical protein [Novosphingobium sp.]|uniref:hypothetical protein n=1 Tax=Novosphingobium sp. TaxID=1874826 RepID=UPI0028AF249F|nr:hypothetical protein [Novosphingobium sp.]